MIVVGGGPAGLLAGLAAIEAGAKDVTVFEFRSAYTRRNMLVLRNSNPSDRRNWLGFHNFKAKFHDLRPNVKRGRILLLPQDTAEDPIKSPGLVPIRHLQNYLHALFERLGGTVVNRFAVGRCDYEDRASAVITSTERIRDRAQIERVTSEICGDTSATSSKEVDGVTYELHSARLIFEATGAGLGYIKPQNRDYVSYEECRRCKEPNCKERCQLECPTLESIESRIYPRWPRDQKKKDLDQYEIDNPRVVMEPTRSVSVIVCPSAKRENLTFIVCSNTHTHTHTHYHHRYARNRTVFHRADCSQTVVISIPHLRMLRTCP